MNYALLWEPSTVDELADAWLNAPDREAVTEASYRLEQALANDPYACGFERDSPATRTAIDLPLGVDYEIIEEDKLVRILRVWSMY